MQKELDLTKKMDFDNVFSWTFKLFKQHFFFLAKSMSFFFIPGIIILTVLLVLIYPAIMNFIDDFVTSVQDSVNIENSSYWFDILINFIKIYLLIIGVMVIYSLFMLASSAASIKALGIKLEKKNEKETDVFKYVLKKFLPLLLTVMISGIMIAFGFLFCYIPGLILMIYLIFVPNVVILENKYFFSAIGRSFSLVNKNFWIIVLILLIFYFIYSFSLGILIMPVYMVPYIKFLMNLYKTGGETDPSTTLNYMANFFKEFIMYIFIIIGISSIASMFYTIIINNALTLKFYNIKNIKEGEQILSDIDKELKKT